MEKPDKQAENKEFIQIHDALETEKKKLKVAPILPYMWKKGQSGNPAGRPKGKTMKEYARELLECQTDEERQEFLHGIPKHDIWKMAEGNPTSELTGKGGKDLIPEIITQEEKEALLKLLK